MPAAAPARWRRGRAAAREVVAIDLSPTLVRPRQANAPRRRLRRLAIDFRVGDMLDPALGRFDHVVAMDSLIHYRAGDIGRARAVARPRSAHRVGSLLFTFAPRTPPLEVMHAVGKLFPARRPCAAIEPVRAALLHIAQRRRPHSSARPLRPAAYRASRAASTSRRLLELYAANEARCGDIAGGSGAASGRASCRSPMLATRRAAARRLLRLSLFQVSVGMAVVLLNGTLNRVMIVELGVPAWLVALMVALPLVFAPFRALIGYRSDVHRSALGWRRVPLHLDRHAAAVRRLRDHALRAARALGRYARPRLDRPDRRRPRLPAGRCRPAHHADRRSRARHRSRAGHIRRPRVVALLYVMLLVGMVASALVFGAPAGRLLARSS
jgi:hypothetical protein